MKQKLRRVLLIDDHQADNFVHARILRKADCAEQIDVCETALQALDYLQTKVEGRFPRPDLIFLDINMPGLDGWEFLDECRKLPAERRGEVVIAMLTSLSRESVEQKLAAYPEVADLSPKPLTSERLLEILTQFFPSPLLD